MSAPGPHRARSLAALLAALAVALAIPAAGMATAHSRRPTPGHRTHTRPSRIGVHLLRRSVRVRQGSRIRVALRVTGKRGLRLRVEVIQQPPGSSVRVRPAVVRAGRRTTMLIRTSRRAPSGHYAVRLVAVVVPRHRRVRILADLRRLTRRQAAVLRVSILALRAPRRIGLGVAGGPVPSAAAALGATLAAVTAALGPAPVGGPHPGGGSGGSHSGSGSGSGGSGPGPSGSGSSSSGSGSGSGLGSGSGSGSGSGGSGSSSSGSGGSSGPVPTHVPTWAYDDGCNGGSGASAALVREWVTFAESHCGPAATKALNDCIANGVTYCTPVEYLDANWIYQQGSVPIAAASQENWWLHDPGYTDAAHRVYVNSYGGGNLLNDSVPAVQSWFDNYLQTNFNAYPALMMDDTQPTLSSELYYAGLQSTEEITTDAQLQAAHEAMAAALTHTDGTPFLQIDNALNPNPYLAQAFPMLNHPSAVQGLVAEGFPMYDGTLTNWYASLLDSLAYIDTTQDDFIVMLSYDTSGSLRARRVQAATELLGYDGNHVVSWSDLETDSGDLAVWPEEGIVPTDPLESMGAPGGSGCFSGDGQTCSTGGHNSIEVAPGVYRREFGDCYDQGVSFGPCAAIVNTTSSPVTVQRSWLEQSYGHEITFDGGDVQSGGTVDLTGAPFVAGSSTVGAEDALLLAP